MTALEELATRFGTPLYVYDLDEVASAYRALRTNLPEHVELCYSVKANPHPALIAALRAESGDAVRAEISSVGELGAARSAGVPAQDCLYTGPGKTAGELSTALACGVRLFSVESAAELRRLGEWGLGASALIRVNGSAAGAGIQMTGTASQFGIGVEELHGVLPELLRVPGVQVCGLHLFSQSGARDENSLIAGFQHAIDTAAELRASTGFTPSILDIGGGFAAPFAVPGARPGYPHLRARLSTALDDAFPGWREGEPRVLCESGRHIVGACGTLLTSVVDVKRSHDTTMVVLDAGTNVLGGMSALGRLLPMRAVPRRIGSADVAEVSAVLAGPLCTPADVLARAARVPADIAAGDVLAVPNVGAYGLSASLIGFLSRPLPLEVVLRGGEVIAADQFDLVRSPVGMHAEPV